MTLGAPPWHSPRARLLRRSLAALGLTGAGQAVGLTARLINSSR